MDVNERNCKLLSYWIPILVLAVTNRSYAGGRNLASARVSLIGLFILYITFDSLGSST
jgi:hypothetical protein